MIDERIKRRIFIIGVIFVLLTALPAITLFRKQADFQGYNKKILHQSVRKIRIPARRGRIYTSDYKVIADNQITFDLLLYIHEIRAAGRDATVIKVENAIEEMAQLLGRENTFSRKDILRHLNWYPGLPLKVFRMVRLASFCSSVRRIFSSRHSTASSSMTATVSAITSTTTECDTTGLE